MTTPRAAHRASFEPAQAHDGHDADPTCETIDIDMRSSTDPVNIRHATADDAAGWLRLRDALWPGDPHEADIAAYFAGTLAEPEAVLVAAHEPGVLVAIVELSIRRDLPGTDGAPTGYVEGLYIEPQQRASGLTRRLLRAARQWAFERGCAFFASDRDERIVFDRSYVRPAAGRDASSDASG